MKINGVNKGLKCVSTSAIFMSAVALLAIVFVIFTASPIDATEDGGDPVDVSTYDELAGALETATKIKITGDITISSTLNVDRDVEIIMNGKTLTGDNCTAFKVTGNLTLSGGGTIKCNYGFSDYILEIGADNKSGTLSISLEGNISIGTSDNCRLGVFGNGSKIIVDDLAVLLCDITFTLPNQSASFMSDVNYKGVVTHKDCSIKFGGLKQYDPKQSENITMIGCSFNSTEDGIAIDGTFKGSTTNGLMINITKGQVYTSGMTLGSNIELTVSNDSTLDSKGKLEIFNSSDLVVNGKLIVEENSNIVNFKLIDVGGAVQVKGTIDNYGSFIIKDGATVEVDAEGMIHNRMINEAGSKLINEGILNNRGLISSDNASFDVSGGSTNNYNQMIINGTIVGGGETNPLVNASKIELNGKTSDLWISNTEKEAEVFITSVQCDVLTIINSIDYGSGAENSMIRIGAEQFAIKGLKVTSKNNEDVSYNDLSGEVGVSKQIDPFDYNVDINSIRYAWIQADGRVSIESGLSLPIGVPLEVGYNNGKSLLSISGVVTTETNKITVTKYTDDSRTDTESVTTDDEVGSIHLKSGEFKVTGKYTAKGLKIQNDDDVKMTCAAYSFIERETVYTTFVKAIEDCSRNKDDATLCLFGDATIDDVLTISSNVKLTINAGANLSVTKALTIYGTLTSNGNVEAEHIFVGISDDVVRSYSSDLNYKAVVSGSFTVTGYWVVAHGSDVSGVDFTGCHSTSYTVKDSPYVTVHAKAPTKIGIIVANDSDDGKWAGWYADGKKTTDVSDRTVGEFDTVYAIFDDGGVVKDCLLVATVIIFTIGMAALLFFMARD